MQTLLRALKARLEMLRGKGFVRSVGVLAGGTAFAQGLMVLALPLITRLYTPEDFSVLAVYVPALAIVSVIACLRLEIAIPLPENDADAANLLALALASSAMISVIVGVLLWVGADYFISWVGQPRLAPYLWLLPLGIWAASSYAALQYWCSRKKQFGVIARTRMTQALSGIGTQIGLGYFGVAPFGLLLGHMINGGAGFIGLARTAWCDNTHVWRNVSWAGMQSQLRAYDRFPKYSVFEALSNNAGVQLPIIIIAALAIGPEAGYLMLATRVMAAPVGLIGGSVAQVYLSQAPVELRAGNLGAFTLRIIGGLAKTGAGPLAFLGITAPFIFPILFGNEWTRAGELVAWMTPWFIAQFISSPISMSLHVCGRQRTALVLQILGFCIRVGAVVMAAAVDRAYIVEIYAVSGFVFYIIYTWVILSVLNVRSMEFLRTLILQYKPMILWLLLAVTTSTTSWLTWK